MKPINYFARFYLFSMNLYETFVDRRDSMTKKICVSNLSFKDILDKG